MFKNIINGALMSCFLVGAYSSNAFAESCGSRIPSGGSCHRVDLAASYGCCQVGLTCTIVKKDAPNGICTGTAGNGSTRPGFNPPNSPAVPTGSNQPPGAPTLLRKNTPRSSQPSR